MKTYATLLLISCLSLSLAAQQQYQNTIDGAEKQVLTIQDSIWFSKLPELQLPDDVMRRSLPYMVDNSELIYFRPLVAQVGLECGQAASIGIMFTYEINAARGVSGTLPENQYVTHFTYNFLNGGSDAGVNYYETFEIVKRAGNPNVADYGGMNAGGPSRWMSGYDKYHSSMKNRINDVFSVKTNTIEGIETMKQWIYDHGNGSEAGGIGSFYAQFGSPNATLPPGTPEAGKYVFTQFGGSPNHAMAIVGYNDSIRYDYNGDGQYTNHIDINGDGIVDARDWEIGGFKMANTYGNVNWWGDNGFSYMMYKTVADKIGQGGIWNHMIAVVDVKDYYAPLLTAKASITYPCRNRLKVMVGYADDLLAEVPDIILHFPIFDFQGGCHPMQGNSASNTIEFGLDLNYLLAYATPNQTGKYFLMVQEDDAAGQYSGTINSFAIRNYVDGNATETSYGSSKPIENNTITYAGIAASIDFDPVNIVQEDLPGLQAYQPYSVQLEAEGGTPPYRWSQVDDYTLTDSTATMPNISFQQLQFPNNSNGITEVVLPFEFPFFGEKFNKVYVTVDGYIRFDESLIPWPFYIDGKTYFLQNKMISPNMSHPFLVAPSEGDGVWMEAYGNYIAFRWKLSVSNSVSTTSINMVAKLYKSGKIEFIYGEQNVQPWVRRYGGISAGDGENYVYLNPHGIYTPSEGQYYRFNPLTNITGLSLSQTGLLSGTVDGFLQNEPIKICVTDRNNVRQFRSYLLNSEGVIINAQAQSDAGGLITFGEHFSLDIEINNINPYPLTNITMTLSVNNEHFDIIENQHFVELINAWTTDTIFNIFDVFVDPAIPNGHSARFNLVIQADEGTWSRNFYFIAYAPVLDMVSLVVNDGNNGLLEPGETAWIEMMLANNGGASLFDVSANISSSNEYIEIISAEITTDTLEPENSWLMLFEVKLSEDTPPLELVKIDLLVTGHHGFTFVKTYPILTSLIIEDFETGDFSSFDWLLSGDSPWFITNHQAYEGTFSARSGAIGDDEVSSMALQYNVAYNDSISFYFKVSSEAGYDFLRFLINNEEKGAWSGTHDWTMASYPVSAGENLFVWQYAKDYSISVGEDCARVDYIVFPAYTVYTGLDASPTQSPNTLKVYPNPFVDQLTIELDLTSPSDVRILLTDASGRLLFSEALPASATAGKYVFNALLGDIPAGMYFVVVQTNQGAMVKRIIRP